MIMTVPAGQANPAKISCVWIGWVFFIYLFTASINDVKGREKNEQQSGRTDGRADEWLNRGQGSTP